VNEVAFGVERQQRGSHHYNTIRMSNSLIIEFNAIETLVVCVWILWQLLSKLPLISYEEDSISKKAFYLFCFDQKLILLTSALITIEIFNNS